MALIPCKSCGKMVSDRAKACPACGTILIEETIVEKRAVICPDCGAEIPEGVDACPNCGCPVEDATANHDAESVPMGEETAVCSPKTTQKTTNGIIIAIIALAVILIGTFIGMKVHQNKQKQEEARIAEENAKAYETYLSKKQEERIAEENAKAYETNLSLISNSMITGAAEAESAGNLILAVWHNAIYQTRSADTDQYTQTDGSFVSDFNTALDNLFDDSSFANRIDEIRKNQNQVMGYMKDLKNPPKGYEDAYSALKECYDSYFSLTDIVINPTGSLQTVSSDFNDADSSFINAYRELVLYLD